MFLSKTKLYPRTQTKPAMSARSRATILRVRGRIIVGFYITNPAALIGKIKGSVRFASASWYSLQLIDPRVLDSPDVIQTAPNACLLGVLPYLWAIRQERGKQGSALFSHVFSDRLSAGFATLGQKPAEGDTLSARCQSVPLEGRRPQKSDDRLDTFCRNSGK